MRSTSFRPALVAIAVVVAAIAIATTAMALITEQRGGAVGILIDISPSNGAGVRDRIVSCAQTAARKAIKDGASLTIAPVTSAPVYIATPPIQTKLSLTDRLTADLAKSLHATALAKANARIKAVLGGTVRADSSDTIDATAIMGDTLQKQPSPRTLIVCGDAHQVSPAFNIYKEHLTPARDRALIRLVEPDLTNLSSIDVIFGAAGLDTKVAFPNAREKAIAVWWTKYWGPAVHAHSLIYGSALPLGG